MKKLLLLSLISLFSFNTQVFSMESKMEDEYTMIKGEYPMIKEVEYNCFSTSFVKDKEEADLTNQCIHISCYFEYYFHKELMELKVTNPEMFENVDYLLYYLLGEAKQIKKQNSKWSSIKKWKNTFSDYMNKLTGYDPNREHFPYYSFHETLDIFIETFSSSSSNEINDKRKIKKEIMKKFFKNKLYLFIDKYINKEKDYSNK